MFFSYYYFIILVVTNDDFFPSDLSSSVTFSHRILLLVLSVRSFTMFVYLLVSFCNRKVLISRDVSLSFHRQLITSWYCRCWMLVLLFIYGE